MWLIALAACTSSTAHTADSDTDLPTCADATASPPCAVAVRDLGWLETPGGDETIGPDDCGNPIVEVLADELAWSEWRTSHIPASSSFEFHSVDWPTEQVVASATPCRNGGYEGLTMESLVQSSEGTYIAHYVLARTDTDTSMVTRQLSASAMPSAHVVVITAELTVDAP